MEIILGSLIAAVLLPSLCFLAIGVFHKSQIDAAGLPHYLFYAGISSLVSFLLLYGIANLLQLAANASGNILVRYPFVFFMISMLCSVFFLCSFLSAGSADAEDKTNRFRIIKACCVGTTVVLLSEIFLFNYLSFVPIVENLGKGTLPLASASLKDGATFSDGAVIIGDQGGSVSFDAINRQSCCFRIKGSQNHQICNVHVSLSDENYTAQAYDVGSYDFCVDTPRSTVLPVYSSGKMKSVTFTFNRDSAGLRIEQISMNQPDFFFSYFRFFVLTAIVLAILLIKRKKLWRIVYRPQSSKQNLTIFLLVALLCCLSAFISKIPYQNEDIAYPLKEAPENYSCYVQQFDAFQKGQLHLDIPVDAKLADMKNPYDTSERHESEVSYEWDRAYYNGKYYSYFGVVPVLTVYYPYYFLTGSLPGDAKTAVILALLAIPFLILLLRELVCYFCKKINFLLLLLGMAAVVFSSLLYTLQVSADFYYIPYLSAMTFLCMFFFFAFRAAAAANMKKRIALLALSAVAYVFAVGSRPVAAIFVLAVMPVFLRMMKEQKELTRTKIKEICAFVLPILMGALLLMKYNYDRFNSPLEFGILYQLTVDNTKYNTVSILNVIPAVYHYFLQFPSIDAQFPFLHVIDKPLNYYASYKWHSVMLGVMSFPLLWSILGMRHVPTYKSSKYNRAFFWIVLFSAAVLAILNFSMSGTDIRYVTDFTLPLSALALVIHLDFDSQYDYQDQSDCFASRLRKFTYSVSAAAMCASVLVGMAAVFSNETNRIFYFLPSVYAELERLCMFW